MVLKFEVKEQTVTALPTNSIPRTGSRKYLKLKFKFSEDWMQCQKTLFLQHGGYSLPIIVQNNEEVLVPEYFTAQDSFLFMLVAIAGETSYPTNNCCVTLNEAGTSWEANPPSTDAPAYQQLVQQVNQAAADSIAAAEAAAARAENASREAATLLGNAAWIAFEMGEDGYLYAVTAPGFEGATFYLTENGYLEVSFNG